MLDTSGYTVLELYLYTLVFAGVISYESVRDSITLDEAINLLEIYNFKEDVKAIQMEEMEEQMQRSVKKK